MTSTDLDALARIMRTELQPDEWEELSGGIAARWFFPNGYGASVIKHNWSYGVELAVLKGAGGEKENWTLTYDTPITNDVIGRIESAEELSALLFQIRCLPVDENE